MANELSKGILHIDPRSLELSERDEIMRKMLEAQHLNIPPPNFGPISPYPPFPPQQTPPPFKEPAEVMLEQLVDFERRHADNENAVEAHKRGLDNALARAGETGAIVKRIKKWLLEHLDEMPDELKDRAMKAGLK